MGGRALDGRKGMEEGSRKGGKESLNTYLRSWNPRKLEGEPPEIKSLSPPRVFTNLVDPPTHVPCQSLMNKETDHENSIPRGNGPLTTKNKVPRNRFLEEHKDPGTPLP